MRTAWVIVLAAGEGSRLRTLTTSVTGVSVPKQFCSLRGGHSLLQDALQRAAAVSTPQQTLTVVAAQHRRWWRMALQALPADNLIVQPHNKGTAVGLLLPLLHLIRRDPGATVLILPSDHFVREPTVLIEAMRRSVQLADRDRSHLYLLGLQPDCIDPELGYILPAPRATNASAAAVRLFIEKPRAEVALGLLQSGALCNTFILATSASALLALYANRHPALLRQLSAAVTQDAERPRNPLAAHTLSPRLTALDFSRDLLEGQESALRVLRVPACGWSDLGTPQRVAEALRCVAPAPVSEMTRTAYMSLAEQCDAIS